MPRLNETSMQSEYTKGDVGKVELGDSKLIYYYEVLFNDIKKLPGRIIVFFSRYSTTKVLMEEHCEILYATGHSYEHHFWHLPELNKHDLRVHDDGSWKIHSNKSGIRIVISPDTFNNIQIERAKKYAKLLYEYITTNKEFEV